MSSDQKQALQHYRQRLVQQGLKRFEVIGRDEDQTLIKGKILAALRASPLVGAELDLGRPAVKAREIGLFSGT
ncbi:MAG: hypothetical protein Q4B17_11750 [Lautropia sp.]|nr:hypothetical protein [Lautropia sp.]